jgi:hypothetical protein
MKRMSHQAKVLASIRRYVRAHRGLVQAGLLVVVIAIAGVWGMSLGHAATGCEVTDKLVNPCRPWLGAAAGNYTQVASGVKSQMLYHEQRIGKQVDIVHTYHGVGTTSLTSDDIYFATRQGTMLFADWKPASPWSSAGGSNATVNANIDKMAASVKSLGSTKLFITIWHEPENDVSSDSSCPKVNFTGNAGTPTQYRAMWQNVENRFKAAGVTNVVWVYDLMNYDPDDCLVNDLYPGNDLTDWVMFNGYGGPNSPDYVANVSHMYNYLTVNSNAAHDYLSKPWGIVEWNVRNASTDLGKSYYDAAKAALDAGTFPLLKAYMIFDSVGPDGNENRIAYDAAGKLSPTKQQEYINFANDPIFSNNQAADTDTTPPTANLVIPPDPVTANGLLPITGSITDNKDIASVRLLVDGKEAASQTTGPFDPITINWDSTTVSNGSHSIVLEATDGSGNQSQSAVMSVTVSNPDTTAPSVPSSLTASAIDGTAIGLNWAASTDFNGV